MEWVFIAGAIALFFGIYYRSRKKLSSLNRRTPERRKICLPMIIEAPYDFPFSVLSYDLSVGGCFLSLNDMNQSMVKPALLGKRAGLKIGQTLKIHLQTGRFSSLNLDAEVIRYELEPQGQYPAGIGIRFKSVSKKNLRKLNYIIFDRDKEKKKEKEKEKQRTIRNSGKLTTLSSKTHICLLNKTNDHKKTNFSFCGGFF